MQPQHSWIDKEMVAMEGWRKFNLYLKKKNLIFSLTTVSQCRHREKMPDSMNGHLESLIEQ